MNTQDSHIRADVAVVLLTLAVCVPLGALELAIIPGLGAWWLHMLRMALGGS